MSRARLLIIAIATICVVALAAFGLVNSPPQAPGDDIIIKGGSMEIDCGNNHGKDCLGHTNGTYVYTHKKSGAHIMHIEVRSNTNTKLYAGDFDAGHQPQVAVTFK